MTEIGFVPPVARKKLQAREQRRIHTINQNRLISLVLCAMVFSFVSYNIWYIRYVRASGKTNGEDLPKASRKQGALRGRAWVSQDSQPFVSAVGRVMGRRVQQKDSHCPINFRTNEKPLPRVII